MAWRYIDDSDALLMHVRDDTSSRQDEWTNTSPVQLHWCFNSGDISWCLCCFYVVVAGRLWVNLSKPTGHVMHQQFNIQQLYVLPTLYLYVLYLSENKHATCTTYSINWLVFITEMKSVYCAVRTGSLNKAVCASYLMLRLLCRRFFRTG